MVNLKRSKKIRREHVATTGNTSTPGSHSLISPFRCLDESQSLTTQPQRSSCNPGDHLAPPVKEALGWRRSQHDSVRSQFIDAEEKDVLAPTERGVENISHLPTKEQEATGKKKRHALRLSMKFATNAKSLRGQKSLRRSSAEVSWYSAGICQKSEPR